MPQTTPRIKVDAVQSMGAEVVLAGDSYDQAKAHCDTLVAQTGMTFIHPFDDPLVIAGQGTIGAEIVRHSQDQLSAVFVPVGGGGLVAGIAGYIKSLRPDVKMIGVEPFEADAMYRSLAHGRRVQLDHVGIFADGVAVRGTRRRRAERTDRRGPATGFASSRCRFRRHRAGPGQVLAPDRAWVRPAVRSGCGAPPSGCASSMVCAIVAIRRSPGSGLTLGTLRAMQKRQVGAQPGD